MARRFFAGALPGGGYRIRQSKPGFDAGNPATPLDGLTFDSDYIPGRIIGSNDFYFNGSANAQAASQPAITSIAHGLGVKPDHLIALAKPEILNTSTGIWEPEYWTYYSYQLSQNGGLMFINNFNMEYRYCAPFIVSENRGGAQGTFGWQYVFDATNITVTYYGPGSRVNRPIRLHVRWTAIMLS